MSEVDYDRVTELFQHAIELAPGERNAFLDRACGDDAALRAEIASMLRHDADASGALDDAQASAVIEIMREARFGGARAPGVPETIGRYRIIRRIATGGMGTVYEAEQDHPQRTVALKMIHRQRSSSALVDRFRREADLLGRLQHPGIAQIYDAGAVDLGDGAQPYIAMELVRGGHALTKHADIARLDLRQRLDLLARICDAVDYAHRHGVIHRDLKPDNVLVDDEGLPKIVDFGVAHATESSTALATLTGEGQLIGTLAYMAPEQVRGNPDDLTPRTDVYALGVLAFELLAGRLPVDIAGLSITTALRLLSEGRVPRLGDIEPLARGDVETIIGKALEKEPDRRYESAAALATDIRRYLDDLPIAARPPSRIYRIRKFTRRNTALVCGVTATTLALVLGIIGTSWYALDARQNQAAALWQAYRSNISAAGLALNGNDIPAAEGLLDEAPTELRGWEWYHLRRQLQSWEAVLDAASPAVGDFCVDDERAEVLAALADGDIGIWSTDDWRWIGRRTTDLELTTLSPRAVDGTVAVGTRKGDVVLWNRTADVFRPLAEAPAQESHDPLTPGKPPVRSLQFNGDGSTLLITRESEARLVRVPSGRTIDRTDFVPHYRQEAAVDPNGRFVVLARDRGSPRTKIASISIWDTQTNEQPASHLFRDEPIAVAFHPADALVAVGTKYRNVHLFDLETHAVVGVLSGHGGAVHGLAFSADGAYLTSASGDGSIIVWNVALRERIKTFFDRDIPEIVRFGDDDRTILSRARGDAPLRVWSLDHEPSRVLGPFSSYVYRLACSPDGSMVAVEVKDVDEVTVWRIDGDVPVLAHELPQPYGVIAFSPDSRFLWGGGDESEGESALWDLQNGTRETPFTEKQAVDRYGTAGLRWGKGDRFNPDGRVRAMISSAINSRHHGMLLLRRGYAVESPRSLLGTDPSNDARALATLIGTEASMEERAHGCAFSPDGRHLAAGLAGGMIRVWDLETMTSVAVLGGHTSRVYCVEYSPDGTRLASGSNDNTIRIWSVETGETLLELRGHTSYVYDLLFSPDGTRLFSASGDKTVRMWETAAVEFPAPNQN